MEQSLGYGWSQIIHAHDRERVLNEWRQAVDNRGVFDSSYRIRHVNGSRRYIRATARPLPSGASEIAGYVGAALDITSEVMAERRLRRNNELLKVVLENLPCGVSVFDAAGKLLLDNEQYRSLLELPESLQDERVTDFGTLELHAGAKMQFNVIDVDSPATGPGLVTEGDVPAFLREETQPDGRVLEVRHASMPAGGTVTTYTDITQHKQVIESLRQAKAAAEQAGAAKATFLATMSHEIRTPMNGVIGITNLLLETRLNADQQELVKMIHQSGESLLVVINDILDYTRIESGQMELEWLPVRVQEVVEGSARLLAIKAQEKNIRIVHRVEDDVPAVIYGDRTRLQQVLVNLISNAVKFTEKGEVRVTVANAGTGSVGQSGCATGDMCTLAVSVQDTGVGIARDKVERLFEPFVQADSSTARRFGGTGLGLAIAKRLVQAMGGSVALDSEIGVGTTVRFDFVAEVAMPKTPEATGQEMPLWGKRALIVAGPGHRYSALAHQLKRWGMAPQICEAPSAALALLEVGAFDLVLAATDLPGMSGLQFARHLQTEDRRLPFILLSQRRASKVPPDSGIAAVLNWNAPESVIYETLVGALDAAQTQEVAAALLVSQFDSSLGKTMPLRILLAEDNEINCQVARRMLRSFGYEPDVACNGMQAIEAVRQRRYDLVLMDIQMPEVDGLQATRFIIENFRAHERPRIVALSASVMREDVEAAIAAGADDYVGKPFSVSELRNALEQAAGCSASPNELRLPEPPPEPNLLANDKLWTLLAYDSTGAFLAGLARSFSAKSQQSLEALRSAVSQRDIVQVKSLVHDLQGMSAVMGAERLTHVFGMLQKLAGRGSLEGAALIVEHCSEELQKSLVALDRFLQARGIGQRQK